MLCHGEKMPERAAASFFGSVFLFNFMASGSLLLAAGVDGMSIAQDRFEDGVLWPGGSPLLIVIGGSVGGSMFSVGMQLLMSKKPPNPFHTTVKLFIQPLLAIAATTPGIKLVNYAGVSVDLTETSLLAFSFVIGAAGVAVITRWVIPFCENVLLPKVLGRLEKKINDIGS